MFVSLLFFSLSLSSSLSSPPPLRLCRRTERASDGGRTAQISLSPLCRNGCSSRTTHTRIDVAVLPRYLAVLLRLLLLRLLRRRCCAVAAADEEKHVWAQRTTSRRGRTPAEPRRSSGRTAMERQNWGEQRKNTDRTAVDNGYATPAELWQNRCRIAAEQRQSQHRLRQRQNGRKNGRIVAESSGSW